MIKGETNLSQSPKDIFCSWSHGALVGPYVGTQAYIRGQIDTEKF
jgi:hypothetical protein